MLVLGIESTCDETAASVVIDGKKILSNVISSQIDLHKEFGGVVPELACRRHVDIILKVVDEALKEAKVTFDQIDLIAVAKGPGLIGALLIGLNTAKALSFSLNIPYIGVNHIEAHLFAAMMNESDEIQLPALGVVLSGGHTTLILIKALGDYEMLGQTVDDAIGEAFDKVAKILDLPYPGGPEIEKLALNGDKKKYPFKPGVVKQKPYHFSFSGLKTAVLYTVKGQDNSKTTNTPLSLEMKQDIAASFQSAAFSAILSKTKKAAAEYGCRSVIFGGGVTNNNYLKKLFETEAQELKTFWPKDGLSLDNAAMIAGLGYEKFKSENKPDGLDLEALTSISF